MATENQQKRGNVTKVPYVRGPSKWDTAHESVYNEYMTYLKSISKREFDDKIGQAKYIINERTGYINNYVTFDCRMYDKDGNERTVVEEDGYKFLLNKFFEDEKFHQELKDHYNTLYGYTMDYISKKRPDMKFRKYTHLKFYF